MTWLAKNRRRDSALAVQICEIERIVQLREQGFNQKAFSSENSEMQVRNYAIDLIVNASKYGASDIHIMMRGTHAEVQFEIQSKLYHFVSLFHDEGGAIARAIFQGLAQTKAATFEDLAYQNAQISGTEFPAQYKIVSCRVFRGPAFSLGAASGSFMTLRLQYLAGHQKENALPPLAYPKRPAGRFDLEGLGYSKAQALKIERLMNTPFGATFFSGPTGSGKTSTLFAILEHLARIYPFARQVSVEDPTENPMPWAVQMVITNAKNDEEVGIEYANLVRGALRMAPKILFIGEIRGPVVALCAIEAALTGHSLWSTIHATDPFLILDRIELMDHVRLNRKFFCDPQIVRGLIAQRLLPRLCPHCKVALAHVWGKGVDEIGSSESKPDLSANSASVPRLTQLPQLPQLPYLREGLVETLRSYPTASQESIYLAKEGGCEHCNFTGSSGRFAIAEIVVCDELLMADFVNHGTATARANYRARPDADPPILSQALSHLFGGQVDPRDIELLIDTIPAHMTREMCS